MSHENGKVREMCAGAGGVCAVCVTQPAVLCRPVACHGAFGVAPE